MIIRDKEIKAVILDWTGTTTDFGGFAPLEALRRVFLYHNIEISLEEIREHTGLLMRDHIRALLKKERICKAWFERKDRLPKEEDVTELYESFESMLLEVLPNHCKLISGVSEIVEKLKRSNIKIGTTTEYNSGMIQIVSQQAELQGYRPDCIISSDDVPVGRPHPWMCYKNAIELQVHPMSQMVKVGDMISDIEEGLNAGMWTVGIVIGGSEFGWSEDACLQANQLALGDRAEIIRHRFMSAGAHEVINRFEDLPAAVKRIQASIRRGLKPW